MHAPTEARRARARRPSPRQRAAPRRRVRLLEPDAARFRCPVPEAARLLRLLTFSGTHPLITDGQLLTAEEIVTVLLDGVLLPAGDAAC